MHIYFILILFERRNELFIKINQFYTTHLNLFVVLLIKDDYYG